MRPVAQRIAHAAGMVGSRALSGWCEKFVRQSFGFPARYSSALLAWAATKRRHGDINNAPAGVPIFWRLHPKNPNYGLGHVALSVGGGYCISTSVGPGGSIGKVKIADLTRAWGMTPLGWTEDYHGQTVWTPPVKTTPTPLNEFTQEDEVPKAIKFASHGVDDYEHLYFAFPHAREYEHLTSKSDVRDYERILTAQGFEVVEWKNASGTNYVANVDGFGRFVGNGVRPRTATRKD